MRWIIISVFARNFWRNATTPTTFYMLYAIFLVLAGYAAVSGFKNHKTQQKIRQEHQVKARQSWEANPDKHPHRMAHFGTFAFREQPPLAILDYGIESFTGSTIFLEAHQQNSVNFSEATFSTGTLRFGELTSALLLQLVLPLLLFFIGFSTVAADRQNGTLKILLSQGASWKELLVGKSLGLLLIALVFFIPVFLLLIILLSIRGDQVTNDHLMLRCILIALSYFVFLFIISVMTILVSAGSSSSKSALLRLLSIWLVLLILLPKSTQAFGNYLYPTPSKIAFQSSIEREVIKQGDSHNPDDPHYQQLKDSVLQVHKVKDITDLPFNYAGFVMREGEKISSAIYRKHNKKLIETYRKQNNVMQFSAIINPFTAIKLASMQLSGTDYTSYVDFQEKADTYRYDMAQTMNELQMKYISPKKKSGSEGKKHIIDHDHWQAFEDFSHEPMPLNTSIIASSTSLLSLGVWILIVIAGIIFTSKRATAL